MKTEVSQRLHSNAQELISIEHSSLRAPPHSSQVTLSHHPHQALSRLASIKKELAKEQFICVKKAEFSLQKHYK
jgi:hypothetical protein